MDEKSGRGDRGGGCRRVREQAAGERGGPQHHVGDVRARLKDTATAFDALIEALQSLEWADGGERRSRRGSRRSRPAHRDVRDGRDANPRDINPRRGSARRTSRSTCSRRGGEADPVAAAKRMEAARRERENNQTPIVRLVWIGGSAGAMQLVNVYMAVSAMLST